MNLCKIFTIKRNKINCKKEGLNHVNGRFVNCGMNIGFNSLDEASMSVDRFKCHQKAENIKVKKYKEQELLKMVEKRAAKYTEYS